MYQIAYIGRWETLPETAAAICDHDTPKLEALLQGGLDLDVPIQLSEYIKLMPLEIAVFRNDVPMIHFLLEHGADPGLAEEQPLLLTAARCCGPEVVALFAGQAAKLSSKQKERAFQEVRWGQRAENIQVLEQAGITVDKFGGEAFRAAVSEGNTKLARLLLEKGADINYHKPDMVFPNAPTAVTEAARQKPVRYELGMVGNEDLDEELGEDEYFGFGVDAGMGCVADIQTQAAFKAYWAKRLEEDPDIDPYNDLFCDLLEENAKAYPKYQGDCGDWLNWTVPGTDCNLPIFASGWGDGYYPVYFGYDAKGKICAVYVRFIDIEASYREQD